MTPAERRELIDGVLEGEVSEADFLRLEAELSVDPAARRDYYDRVLLTVLLEDEAAVGRGSSEAAKPLRMGMGVSSGRRWRWAFAGMAMVASLLLAVVVWQRISPGGARAEPGWNLDPTRSGDGAAEAVVSGFAVVSGQVDVAWADGRTLTNGGLVPTGELHLRSGLAEFELFSGVVLVVEGESRFSILSPMEVAVSRGKIRARVPESAQGFRILTDAGDVVDLGTEFAVGVTGEGSEVHVLEGEVEWQARGLEPRRIVEGEAARVARDGSNADFAADSEAFIGPRALKERVAARQQARRVRWRERSLELRQDRRLLAYYRVTPEAVSGRRIENLAGGGRDGEGAVVGAMPAANRWGESESALDFSPAGSRVRLSIPGEHQSLTLFCWVKINSLDRWYNSLFLTDGHEQGEPHWQVMNDGRLFFSVKKRDRFDRSKGEQDKHIYYSPPFWNSSLIGQWVMIATVYDVEAREVTHYLNGAVLSAESIPEEYLVDAVRIGNASLGNWGLPERDEPRFAVRNLNGSLDEFALFGAALSADEIRRLYDDGTP